MARRGTFLRKNPILTVAAILYVALSSVHGQYIQTLQPDVPYEWEAEVLPPPVDDWKKNMPAGWRESRALPAHPVRAFYLVPSNRAPMPGAVDRIRDYLLTTQEFFREQMDRNGFGPKTIALETEADGITPKVHVVNASNIDSYYRASPWARVASAAQASGLPVWSPGQVWLGIFETHLLNPDGSIIGEYNGGSSFGSGSDAGLGITNSNTLAIATMDRLTSDVPYHGTILPELGPYPMVSGVTAHSAEGDTLARFASTRLGVVVHELSHGFGLPHDFRNDVNRFGNIMGNGFRGIHAWVHPDLYGSNTETRLGYGNALALNISRYFNGPRTYTDNNTPTLIVSSSTSGTVSNGKLVIPFSASDPSGLSAAWLQLDGNLVGELSLEGTLVNTSFETPYYEVSTPNDFSICVFDSQGNKRTRSVSITVPSGTNRAPRPYFSVVPSIAKVGQQVTINPTFTSDPDNGFSTLMIEWDYDGDGIFDTPPARFYQQTRAVTFATPGVRHIYMRVTDPSGAASISAPIPVRVVAEPSKVTGWELY